MKNLALLTIALLLLCIGTYAGAATVSFTDSIPLSYTTWTPDKQLVLPKFDTSLGTLISATVEYSGKMIGDIDVENTDNVAQLMKLTQTGMEVFTLPDSSKSVLNYKYELDQLLNPGGIFTTNPVSSLPDSFVWMAPLSDVSGIGFFYINVAASGNSSWTGSNNLDAEYLLQAKADAKVTYNYKSKVVPEGNTLLGLLPVLSGLVGSAELRRRVVRKMVKK